MGGLPTTTVNAVAVNPADPKIMYVGMRDGVFRSDNAGHTWTRVTDSVKNIAAITVNPRTPHDVYAMTADGTIVHSTDGGKRWNAVR